MTSPLKPTQRTPEHQKALEAIVRYLALRDHSRNELAKKLARRFAPEVIEWALDAADERKLLAPDNVVAETVARHFQRRLKSQTYIAGQLRKRGLPVPAKDDEKELANARALMEKKWGAPRRFTAEERQKVHRFLRYRGFQDSTIRKAMNDFAAEFTSSPDVS